jgi:hypothetical protein
MKSWVVLGAQMPGYLRFRSALRQPETCQRRVLRDILGSIEGSISAARYGIRENTLYEKFKAAVPVTDYAFWEEDILKQKQTGENVICAGVKRFQPTSGSTSAQKWIPYSQSFLREMDSAIQAWIGDAALKHRTAFRGCQYWSLSWLPEEQRDSRPSNDDLELLPTWKRYLMEGFMAVPAAVTYTCTMEESQFATLAYLCARRDLSLVSVWSPTFWLKLVEQLSVWRESLASTLHSGKWSMTSLAGQLPAPQSKSASSVLGRFEGEELLRRLWPKLKMISCWDSAGSSQWAKNVRSTQPTVNVQGKGLWATEGVITVPFQGHYPAAITSHFLEWLDLDDNRVLPTWKLRPGQQVQPLLSGGHGLLRYKLNDSLLVTGFLQETPTFQFQGRLRETDLVGEKLSALLAEQAFSSVESETGVRPLSLFAVRTEKRTPFYLALVRHSDVQPKVIAAKIETALAKIFHYKLARELGQLGPVRLHLSDQPEVVYQQVFQKRGMLTGDIKFEALSEIAEHLLP